MRTLGRSVVGLGLIALVLPLGASVAFAHATYKSSNPADESTVSTAPSNITAEFTEPMTGGSYMDVTDPCGRDSGSGSNQTGSSMSVQNSSTAVGIYSVFWRAVSIDGHTTEGTFTFTVSGGEQCPGEADDGGSGTRAGGGGSGGTGGGSGSGASGSGGTEAASAGGGSSSGHEGRSKDQHGKHGRGVKNRDRKDGAQRSGERGGGTAPLAGARSDAPDAPSAIDGIPLDGLLITLAVAALIGAAAGKIYVSLSGDDS